MFVLLQTGWLFGHISQKGPMKRGAPKQICGIIFSDFFNKGRKGAELKKKISLLLSYLILGMSKKNYYFPTDMDINNVFLQPKFLQKVNIIGDQIFFPHRLNFYSGLAEKFCNELATLSQLRPFLKIWTKSDGITPKSLFFGLYCLEVWIFDQYLVLQISRLGAVDEQLILYTNVKVPWLWPNKIKGGSRKTNLIFYDRYNFLSVFFAVWTNCVKMQKLQTLVSTQPRKGGNLKPAHKCRWFLEKETFETQWLMDCLLYVYDIFWHKEPAFLELLKAVADNVELVRGDEDVLVLLDRELEGELFSSLRNRTGHTATKVVPWTYLRPWSKNPRRRAAL